MSIPTCVLTNKGAALQAKTPSGAQIPATRWQMGTGTLPAGEKLEDMTQLVQPLTYRPISSVTNSGRQCLVLGQFVNEGMDAFDWEELGLWAQDPDEGEILYAVGNARGEGEHIEAWTDKVREFVFGMELVFSGTANVTAEINRTLVFATLKDLDAAISAHNDAPEAHPAMTARTRGLEMALHGSETLTGEGAPTPETEGKKDQHYIDLTTGEEYVCTAAEDGTYTWKPAEEGTSFMDKIAEDMKISAETSEMLGGAETPNEAFSLLGKYNQYWWRHREKPEVLFGDQKTYTLNETVLYSDEYTFVFPGSDPELAYLSIKDPTEEIALNSGAVTLANEVLPGKYILRPYGTVVYIVGNARSSVDKYAPTAISIDVKEMTIQWPNTEWQYVSSSSPDAYPNNTGNGEKGDIQYQFLGKPLDNAIIPYNSTIRMEYGYYIGTGVCGEANKNSLTFSFTPKFVFIVRPSGDMDRGSGGLPYIWGQTGFVAGFYGPNWIGCQVTLDGRTMSWHNSSSLSSGGDQNQLNLLNVKYMYFAVG